MNNPLNPLRFGDLSHLPCCHLCNTEIHDTTTARPDRHGHLICAPCLADEPVREPMSPFGAALFGLGLDLAKGVR